MSHMETLEGKRAVVTGASSGIGRAVALELVKMGVFVSLVARNSARLEEVAREARGLGTRVSVFTADLADDERLFGLVRSLRAGGEGLDILVHSAGVVTLSPMEGAHIEDLDRQYRLNLRAPYVLTQALLGTLTERRGQVVFINSGAGLVARAGWGQYAASKHALKAVADSLRAEQAGRLRVMSVYPGRTASPMQMKVHHMEGRSYQPEAFVQPEDIAKQLAAALLLPDRASVTDLSIRPGA